MKLVAEIIVKCKSADTLPIDRILEFQGELKKLSKKNKEKLKKSILTNGFIAPFFVWDDNGEWRLIDGHQRLSTLISMRQEGFYIPMLPVDYIEAENEQDARKKLLAITSQYGEFNVEELESWVKEIEDNDFFRFSDGELDIQIENQEDTEGDDELPEHVDTVTKTGDLWQLGEHRLACGSSAEMDVVNKVLNGDKPSIVFTDPPYGVAIGDKNKMLNSFQPSGRNLRDIESDNKSPEDLKEILLPIFRNIKYIAAEDCTFFVTAPQGGDLGMMMMMMMRESGLPCRHVLMWYKNAPTFSMGRLDYDYQHEPILLTWGKKHKRPMKGTHKSSVWKVDKPRASADHPTMKPVELYVNAYMNNSDNGDISFEPFAGSGTAIIASEQCGRKCRAIEIDPHYCDVIVNRYKNWMEENNKDCTIKLNGEAWDA